MVDVEQWLGSEYYDCCHVGYASLSPLLMKYTSLSISSNKPVVMMLLLSHHTQYKKMYHATVTFQRGLETGGCFEHEMFQTLELYCYNPWIVDVVIF